MDEYLSTLHEIVTRGLNTNSYKFALWRSLTALAAATDPAIPVVTKSQLAPLFLRYYWPIELQYHVRQGIDPDKDPIVMVLVRRLASAGTILPEETVDRFRERAPAEYDDLLRRIAREAFNDVIPRFHTVHGAPISPAIFVVSNDSLILTAGGRDLLTTHTKLVDFLAVAGWVRFTEKFTSAPKLFDKISGMPIRRGQVSRWRQALNAIQNGRCFYDDAHDMGSPEVDHILPWSFVLEDKTWNLVLACRCCNNGKRDRLADPEAIKRLCARNERISSRRINASSTFHRHFDEWHSRSLSSHIEGLYDQAVADGFPIWKGSSVRQADDRRP